MRTQASNFSGRVTALFSTMLPAPSATEEVLPTTSEPIVAENVDTPTTSQPTTVGGKKRKQGTKQAKFSKAKKAKTQASEATAAQMSQSSQSSQQVVNEEMFDHSGRAASTASSPLAEQDRSTSNKTQPEATPRDDSTPVDDFGGPSTKTKGSSDDHARHESVDDTVNDSPRDSHSEGDEARTNLELTKMVDYVWSKFVEERKKRKAQDVLIATLQQQLNDLQRVVIKCLKDGKRFRIWDDSESPSWRSLRKGEKSVVEEEEEVEDDDEVEEEKEKD